MNFVANIPYTKCWVRKEYLHDLERGHGEFVEAVVLAVKSVQGRALMFEAYLPEYGACFDKFPISAFVWKKDIKEEEFVVFQRNIYIRILKDNKFQLLYLEFFMKIKEVYNILFGYDEKYFISL